MTEEEAKREIAQLEDLVGSLTAAIDALKLERDFLKLQVAVPVVDMDYVNNLRHAYTQKCLEVVGERQTSMNLRTMINIKAVEKAIDDIKPVEIKPEVKDG